MENATTYERILVPVDGSPHASVASEHAIELAKRYDAELHILHVVWTGTPYVGGDSPGLPIEDYVQVASKHGEQAVLEAAERARKVGVPRVVTVVERSSKIGTAILDYASSTGIGLIVIGTHGRTGLERFLVGSVAEHVIRGASIPVMTVRDVDALTDA